MPNKKMILSVGDALIIKRADKVEGETFIITDIFGTVKDLNAGKGEVRLRSSNATSADIYIKK